MGHYYVSFIFSICIICTASHCTVMKKSCTALRKLGSAWISLDPFGVSLDQLRISQPQVVMKEALHRFEIHWRALQSFTELCGCRTCMRAKNSFADPHSNRLLHTSRTLDRNSVLHGVVFPILLWRLDRHTNDANKTF